MWQYKINNCSKNANIKLNKRFFKFAVSSFCLVLAIFFSLITFDSTASAQTYDKMNIAQQAQTYLHYNALMTCAKTQHLSGHRISDLDNKLTLKDAYDFNWFENNASTVPGSTDLTGYILADSGNYICGNDSSVPWIKDMVTDGDNYWGYSNGLDAACELGLRRKRNGSTEVDCKSGKDSSGAIDEAKDLLEGVGVPGQMDPAAVQKTLQDRMGASINLSNPIKYSLYFSAFKNACGGDVVDAENGDSTYTIEEVDMNTGEVTKKIYSAKNKPDQNVAFYYQNSELISGTNTVDRLRTTCKDIANTLKNADLAGNFATQLKQNLKNPDIKKETSGTATGSGESGDPEATCGSTVKIVGWIMCPVVNGLVLLNDGMWNIASFLLTTKPLNQSDSIFKAWSAIRNIANVAFAIAFLIIIFSQISSIGINNYGIKKLLPRLIVCAILVNLSFFIVQIMVDLANISGSSIYNIMQSLVKDSTTYNPEQHWQTLLKGILSAGAGWAGSLAVAAFIGPEILFWMLFPVLIMATLAFFAAIFTLIFRTAMIPILAVLSPLAFVAYLLPNTEQWFKKWKDMFIKMLMLYPLAALVFGGSRLAAVITMGDGDNVLNGFIGGIIMALPLFSLPFLAKQGGDILSKVNGALMNLANKAKNPISNYAKGRQDHAESKYLANGPKPGSIFGSAHRTGHRMYRNRAMRRKTRELETDTNKENFNSDWAEDPTKDEHGKPRTVTEEEAKARRRMGNGYQAIHRSHMAKGRAENIKTAAETSYLDSREGKEMQNRLTAIQTDNQRAKSETKLRTDRLNNDALEKNEKLKSTQEKMDQRRKIRVNESQFGKAINQSINTNQLKINDLAKEAEEGAAASAKGQALHDSINLHSENIKEHALASEQRVAASAAGQEVKQRVQSLKTKIQTAENIASNKYENNQRTFAERLELKKSKEELDASNAETNQTIEEMSVLKTDKDGNYIIERDQFGNAVLDQYGNEKIAPVYTPTMNGMATPAGYADNTEYFNAMSIDLANAKRKTVTATEATNAAQKYTTSQFNKAIANNENLAREIASVQGASENGANIRQAVAIESNSKASRDAVNAVMIKNSASGFGNQEFLQMINSGNRLIPGTAPGDPPFVVDHGSALSEEEYEAAMQGVFDKGWEPNIRQVLDRVNTAPPGETPEAKAKRIELKKSAASMIMKMSNRPKFIGKSLIDSMSRGEGDGKNHQRAVLDTVNNDKYSSEVFANMSNDEFQGMSIVFDNAPIATIADYNGRVNVMNKLLNVYEEDRLRNSLTGEQKLEHDRLLNQLSKQCKDYSIANSGINLQDTPGIDDNPMYPHSYNLTDPDRVKPPVLKERIIDPTSNTTVREVSHRW